MFSSFLNKSEPQCELFEITSTGNFQGDRRPTLKNTRCVNHNSRWKPNDSFKTVHQCPIQETLNQQLTTTLSQKTKCTIANERSDSRASRACATCHHTTSRFSGSTRESFSTATHGKLVVCSIVQNLQMTRITT